MTTRLWPKETIGGLFDIGAGKAMSPSARLGERAYPFLRTANVFWGEVDLSKLDTMNFSEGEIEHKSLKKGDLLVCEGGDIGRSAVWQGQVEKCGFQNHIHRLRPKTPDTVPAFFMYYLQAGFTQLGIYEGAGNKTTIPNLSRGRLAVLEVPNPRKPEQEKIAAALWKVQRAIQIEKELATTVGELKQSAMRQLFAHGIRNENQKETAIGLVPRSWRVDRLIEFAHFQRGFDITKKSQKIGKVPVVSSGGIRSWHDEAGAKGPGVIVGRKGSIGTVHYVEEDYWPHDTTLWCTDFRGNLPVFVYYRLQLLDLKKLDSGATNPALNRNFLHEEVISWPETNEQKEIATILQTIDRKISVHERKRAVLTDLFQTMLNQLMTAQIRVDRLDIDTSEVAALNPENV